MPVAAATRRKEIVPMGLMDKPDPLEELERQLMLDTARNWRKLEYIADVLAKRGIKSPITRKPVTKTDVSRDFHAQGIKMWEALEGEVTDAMLAEMERAKEAERAKKTAKKKSAAKKGGSK
ncbi:hypothetical protein MVI01_54320 [Myxococcus virescens]|uniref:Uncharacterized protein n=2 Tax=Myxococcus virescens TaxID=83456 RepID=A0A511HJB5_9BACT|nr:hypothetical protein MVI01_54320 [Myxococcus virescens]SDE53462.1 hypothetical protein SAMN04488504_10895 [Myxococcus virescens]